jgi:hypothetical protein
MAKPVERLGRFLLVRDVEGTLYAVAPAAVLVVAAIEDDGTVAVLAGGRALRFSEDVRTVAMWFSGAAPI